MGSRDSNRLPDDVWGSLDSPVPKTRSVLLQVGQFLLQLGYSKSLSALQKEAKKNGLDLGNDKLSPGNVGTTLAEMWHSWHEHQEPESGDSEMALDSESSSDSDGSESSSDDESIAAQTGRKRKRNSPSSSSGSSSSDSDTSSDSDGRSNKALNGSSRVRTKRRTPSPEVHESSSSSSDRPAKRVKTSASPTSDDSESETSPKSAASFHSPKGSQDLSPPDDGSGSDTDSTQDTRASGKKIRNVTSSADDDSDNDSSDDSSSSSSVSSSSSSDDSSDSDSSLSASTPPPKKSVRKQVTTPDQKVKAARAASDSSATLSAGEMVQTQDSAPLSPAEAFDQNNGDMHPARAARLGNGNGGSNKRRKPDEQTVKKEHVPFSRIPKDQQVDSRFASNKYVPYDYADRAHRDLIVTKGKGFTKEKNKKKRGSYRGGMIDLAPKGIKFED